METNQYYLTDSDKGQIPYQTNQTIAFNHSNGFEFDLTTTGRKTEWRTTETEHCGDNWSKYEALIVELRSIVPELYIYLEVLPKEIHRLLRISINKNAQFQFDLTSQPDIDTLTINGIEYSDIYQAESFSSDTSIIVPREILYSKEIGIIQITMSNNERFTIDE